MRFAAVALVVLGFMAGDALACECIFVTAQPYEKLSNGTPVPTREELGAAGQYIFRGKVVSFRPKPTGDPLTEFVKGAIATLHVTRYWRRKVPAEVQVESGYPGGGCLFVFDPGVEYLVFARRDDKGVLTTNICTRTTAIEKVPDLLPAVVRLLGRGRAPSQ